MSSSQYYEYPSPREEDINDNHVSSMPSTPVFSEALYSSSHGKRFKRFSQSNPAPVATHILGTDTVHSLENEKIKKKNHLLGTFPVYMTSCETMWGVLIFIKFDEMLGTAGLLHILLGIILSMSCQFLAASSLSAIASNGIFNKSSGGAYYMVVRSLGPAVGAAIGLLYFIGMSLLAAVEIIGAAEALHIVFQQAFNYKHTGNGHDDHQNDLYLTISVYWDQVIFSISFLIFLALIRGKNAHFVHTVGILIMGVVIATFLCCIIGMMATLGGWGANLQTGNDVLKLSSQNFKQNWGSHYTGNKKFGSTILSILYPTFIGIFQGANKISELKNPYKSVPLGAFGSILTSGILYTIVFILLAFVSSPSTLVDPHFHVLLFLAWPSKWIVLLGTIIIGLGSGLSCIDVAPRILRSLSDDGYLYFLLPFSKLHGKTQEPRFALLVTIVICFCAFFMKDIETIATYASLMFLCMYCTMNLSCFCLSILNLHSWRPKFRFYHWSSALVGVFLCLLVMFWLEAIAATLILVFFLFLIIYVHVKGEKVTWGHGLEGIKYQIALQSLLALEKKKNKNSKPSTEQNEDDDYMDMDEKEYHPDIVPFHKSSTIINVNRPDTGSLTDPDNDSDNWLEEEDEDDDWRPQLLCFLKLDDSGNIAAPYLLDFVRQLKGSKGLNMVATVIDKNDIIKNNEIIETTHYYNEVAKMISKTKKKIKVLMEKKKMLGFVEVIFSDNYNNNNSELCLIQTMGLGKLRPNTIVKMWPELHRNIEKDAAITSINNNNGLRLLHLLGLATAFGKAVVSLKPGRLAFPTNMSINKSGPIKGTIDVWWVVHDGGLLLLLGHLLHKNIIWKNCKIRVFAAIDNNISTDHLKMEKKLADYLHDVRIQAEVHVIDINKAEIADFANDWTIRAERYHKNITNNDNNDQFNMTIKKKSFFSVLKRRFQRDSPVTAYRDLNDIFNELDSNQDQNDHETNETEPKIKSNINDNEKKEWDQESAAMHLKAGLMRYSFDSELIILNLPVPSKEQWKEPKNYLHMIDNMTEGFKRVLLVHGSGHEALSEYA